MPSCRNKMVAGTRPEAVFIKCSLADKVMMRQGGWGPGSPQAPQGQQAAWDRDGRFEFYF